MCAVDLNVPRHQRIVNSKRDGPRVRGDSLWPGRQSSVLVQGQHIEMRCQVDVEGVAGQGIPVDRNRMDILDPFYGSLRAQVRPVRFGESRSVDKGFEQAGIVRFTGLTARGAVDEQVGIRFALGRNAWCAGRFVVVHARKQKRAHKQHQDFHLDFHFAFPDALTKTWCVALNRPA